jgi:transcriptional regulatory protein RtcR
MSNKSVAPKSPRPLTVFGLLGTTLDGAGSNPARRHSAPGRWEKWRPTIDLCRHDDWLVNRLELLHDPKHQGLADLIAEDVLAVSPETQVVLHPIAFQNPWDFEEVYAGLHDFAARQRFDDGSDYAIHITTGTHTAQICWFLLAESRRIPAKLLQTGPPSRRDHRDGGVVPVGTLDVIDLDLQRYQKLAQRFGVERQLGSSMLAGGINTKSPRMATLIAELERVATASKAPLLLQGPTGVGKTHMARRIYELKRHKHQVRGPFVEVNCATLRGDLAMSTLFGHKKGSYTGALTDRSGMLKGADGGVLFLDEVGELSLDVQAMLLKAIEDKRFVPMGADQDVASDFQLVCGTHRDLAQQCSDGLFREDLLARIDMWRFELPALVDRREDMGDNLDVELHRCTQQQGMQITLQPAARAAFLAFAASPDARWPGNFREFGASVLRMATLAPSGRIDMDGVSHEIARLQRAWHRTPTTPTMVSAPRLPAMNMTTALDPFDDVQLSYVLQVCRQHRSLADAGRQLFAVSRLTKKSKNDTDRLRKYLQAHGIVAEDALATS